MPETLHTPLISVLMPVYNAQMYLREAIESVLNQTFSDFELLVINDGSDDDSEKIIRSFNDTRIKYHYNEKNHGLIYTLNKGINLAQGRFIARMDSDDICFKERFEVQLRYFDKHSKVSLVCSPVTGITPKGKLRDKWQADDETKTFEQIYHTLPFQNCIAHPTIIIKTDVAKKYLYSKNQKGSEDWDLWMRLAADKKQIIKTNESLLYYRIHPDSITSLHNALQSVEMKSFHVKRRFLIARFFKFKLSKFDLLTFYSMWRTLAREFKVNVVPRILKNTKRLLTVNPFKASAQYTSLKQQLSVSNSNVFLFFPYSHIGGAEKVHIDIVKAIDCLSPQVFFAGLSDKKQWLHLFKTKNANVYDVACALYHPFYAKKSLKLIYEKLTGFDKSVVFGCNNLFFEKLILLLPKKVKVIDLTHNFGAYVNDFDPQYLIKSYLRCDKRIFISNKSVEETKLFYKKYFVDDEYNNRLCLIYNGVNIPDKLSEKPNEPIHVLFVGRNSPEKRLSVVFKIAQICSDKKLPFRFTIIGDANEFRNKISLPNLNFAGQIYNETQLAGFYKKAHLILITSLTEGFPMVIMEAMSYGVVPLCTPVGDIPFHVKNKKSGFLTESLINDADVVNEMTSILSALTQEKTQNLSNEAYLYAKNNFSIEKFNRAYLALFSEFL